MNAAPAPLRRLQALARAIGNLVRLLLDLRAYRADPETQPFPKVIFELPPGAPAAPDGQSSAYLDLAQTFWRAEWSKPGHGAASRLEAALRVIHADVQRAHVLERRAAGQVKGRRVKLAVLKPDHLGDLVLSSPAIRALASAHQDLTLFVNSQSLSLARALFKDLPLEAFDLPHLSKGGQGRDGTPNFRDFDAVAVLRRDAILSPAWAALRLSRYAMPEESHSEHQSLLDYAVAREFVGPYDMDALFFGDRRAAIERKAAETPVRIGLSIGSGFYANAWPLVHWIALGRKLKAQGRIVKLVYGPAERSAAKIALTEIGLSRSNGVEGGSDFQALFDEVADLDLVIASDGGTAHLCSLVTPILSVFGPSPLQRYAPFGGHNRILSQMLPCSPCCQYDPKLINGCLSVECMSGITPDDVLAAIGQPVQSTDVGTWGRLRPGLTLFKGLSHLDRPHKLTRIEQEHHLWTPHAAL